MPLDYKLPQVNKAPKSSPQSSMENNADCVARLSTSCRSLPLVTTNRTSTSNLDDWIAEMRVKSRKV